MCVCLACVQQPKKIINEKQHKSKGRRSSQNEREKAWKIFVKNVKTNQQISPVKNPIEGAQVSLCVSVAVCVCVCVPSVISPCKAGNYLSKWWLYAALTADTLVGKYANDNGEFKRTRAAHQRSMHGQRWIKQTDSRADRQSGRQADRQQINR